MRMQSLEDFFRAAGRASGTPHNPYPTSEEIMAKAIKYKKNTLNVVRGWKLADYKGWKGKSATEQLEALYRLITGLSIVYNKPVCIVNGNEYHYSPISSTIMLDAYHPSIISTLHEFSHHINGSSEKRACRWAVWLFKTVFPKSFDNLQFIPNSHMLCKKPSSTTSRSNSQEQKATS